MKLLLFKDGKDRQSLSYNMVAITFLINSLWLLSWLIGTPFGFAIPPFDVAIATGWFSPISLLYFMRRREKDKEAVDA